MKDHEGSIRNVGMQDLTLYGDIPCRSRWTLVQTLAALILAATVPLAMAETLSGDLPLLESDPPSEKTGYEARVNQRMVHDMDPNVYAYTAEFAKRFQMPEKWITPDLEGAAAVAFRVMPGYTSCGWGGNPNSCNTQEVRCMLDVYFDHEKHPLPWDKRMRMTDIDFYWTSVGFIAATPQARPKRQMDRAPLPRSPFTDPVTGKEMGWQEWMGGTAGGWTGMRAYDREVFKGMSMVILGASCTGVAPKELWLTSEGLYKKDIGTNPALRHLVHLPSSWHVRVKESVAPYAQRNDAHFKKVFEELQKPSTPKAD